MECATTEEAFGEDPRVKWGVGEDLIEG